MAAGLYIEINVFCILILLIFLIKIESDVFLQRRHSFISVCLLMFMAMFAADALWAAMDVGFIKASMDMNYTVNIFYFSLSGIASFFVYIYCLRLQNSRLVNNATVLGVTSTPCIALIVLTINSPFNQWIFYLDESGNYCRGKLYFLQIIVVFGYLITASAISLRNSTKDKYYPSRNLLRSFGSFLFFPIICALLQVILPDYPFTAIGITLAFVVIFIPLIDSQVMTDRLTMLYNKNWFYRYYETISEKEGEHAFENTCIVIIDIDGLHEINESFGKTEGDDALIKVSEILHNLNHRSGISGFFQSCRYGDDEFVVLCELRENSKPENVISYIQTEVRKINISGKVPYDLSVSTGFAQYDKNIKFLNRIVELADEDMYKEKRAKRA